MGRAVENSPTVAPSAGCDWHETCGCGRRPPASGGPASGGVDVLEDNGQALTHADADRRDAPALVALAQHLGEGPDDASAGGAEGVADGDGAAAGVDNLRVDLPRVEARQRLHREGLVELD